MDQETCVTRLIWKFWVWWPFLAWHWPWPEQIWNLYLVSTFFPWSFGAHMESFGRKLLILRSVWSANWIHPILTFDLTLTWHVTSILNFRKWFRSVSSISFECCLAHLSMINRFRDSMGIGSDPPGCGGYRNSPGGGGLKEIIHFRKNIFIYFVITVFHCVIKNKHLPSLFYFILL